MVRLTLINFVMPIISFLLCTFGYITLRTVQKRKALHLCVGSASAERVGQGGGEWGHPQGDMHMVAVVDGCQRAVVVTGWANPCPGCMDRFTKHYSHLVGGSFLARKAAWDLSGCMTTESADYCMIVNEWLWLRQRVCFLRLKVNMASVLQSELGQKWKYGALEAFIKVV